MEALTPEQLTEYRERGFLRIEHAFTPDEVRALLDELLAICRGERGSFQGRTLLPRGTPPDELLRHFLCVHFPHKLSPAIRAFARHPVLVEALTALIGPNVKCVQSMFFVRPAGRPGQAWHQDEFYVPTRDRSLTSAWVALDDATAQNGCLWVIPGSHKRGILWPHEAHDDPRFDPVGEARHHPYTEADAVPLEIEAGGLLLFNGYLLHRSLNNAAPSGFRRSLALHSASAETLLPWLGAEREGPIGGADCRDIVMVAGEDPYAAFKSTEDRCHPWSRPDRIG